MACVFPSATFHSYSRRLSFCSKSNPSFKFSTKFLFNPSNSKQALHSTSVMQTPEAVSSKKLPRGIDETTLEEYASQAKLLQEFNIPAINKAWIFKSENETATSASRAMFSVGQSNLLANKKRISVLTSHISTTSDHSVNFQWSPFPIEMTGVTAVIPSPSGSKLLVIRNSENESPTKLEIWSPQLEKEIHIPQSVHGSVYADGWFEGISWNSQEDLIAYVAEEPAALKPVFNDLGFKKEGSSATDCNSWNGQGDWEEHWGETYSKKRKPSLFVVNINSGEVRAVKGIPDSLSVGQVVWAPCTSNGRCNYLVFVGWLAENGPQQTPRKLGIKYCYNRPCALYAIGSPFREADTEIISVNSKVAEISARAINLTHALSSAFFPRFRLPTVLRVSPPVHCENIALAAGYPAESAIPVEDLY